MTVKEVVEKLNFKVFSGAEGLQNEIIGGYTGDLLSDVMGNAEASHIWITLQTHKNVMAIATLKELAAIVLVKGYKPEEETINQSNEENIPILGTDEDEFEISAKIFNLLNQ